MTSDLGHRTSDSVSCRLPLSFTVSPIRHSLESGHPAIGSLGHRKSTSPAIDSFSHPALPITDMGKCVTRGVGRRRCPLADSWRGARPFVAAPLLVTRRWPPPPFLLATRWNRVIRPSGHRGIENLLPLRLTHFVTPHFR
jgi:hypothetical protein